MISGLIIPGFKYECGRETIALVSSGWFSEIELRLLCRMLDQAPSFAEVRVAYRVRNKKSRDWWVEMDLEGMVLVELYSKSLVERLQEIANGLQFLNLTVSFQYEVKTMVWVRS
jgi:hypothetical protein